MGTCRTPCSSQMNYRLFVTCWGRWCLLWRGLMGWTQEPVLWRSKQCACGEELKAHQRNVTVKTWQSKDQYRSGQHVRSSLPGSQFTFLLRGIFTRYPDGFMSYCMLLSVMVATNSGRLCRTAAAFVQSDIWRHGGTQGGCLLSFWLSPSQQLLYSASSNTNVCSSKNGMNVGHWAWAGIYITEEVLTWIYHILVLCCIVLYNVCCHGKISNELTHTEYHPLDIQRSKMYTL